MIKDRIFVLGGGVQKAGTSWFDSYLKSSPEVLPGYVKEYHVLDTLFIPGLREIGWELKLRELMAAKMGDHSGDNLYSARILDFYINPDRYFQHFADHIKKSSKSVTYDLTVEHSGLTVSDLITVRSKFEYHNFRVKAVIILRDPVERVYSAVRMKCLQKHGKTWSEENERDELAWYTTSFYCKMRTSYELIYKNFVSALGAENVMVLLYEEIFRGYDNLEGLCKFINIAHVLPMIDEVVNSTARPEKLHPDDRAMILSEYRQTYQWALDFFGSSRIKSAWDFDQ